MVVFTHKILRRRYLLGKTDRYANAGVMPDRVVRNTGKSPDKGGYPISSMTSREYAALLALAMLDGTFNDRKVSSTDSIKEANGQVAQGQHRSAALRVLGLY